MNVGSISELELESYALFSFLLGFHSVNSDMPCSIHGTDRHRNVKIDFPVNSLATWILSSGDLKSGQPASTVMTSHVSVLFSFSLGIPCSEVLGGRSRS